jgi:epoxyqueuosine reductase QueG
VRLPKNAHTVIVFLFPYRFSETIPRNLSRYACVPDYHVTAGAVLQEVAESLCAEQPEYVFEAFIDNSPIPEVKAATLAGLGCVGDHGLLIHPQLGSWVFIGSIVTDAIIKVEMSQKSECCHCGACTIACPAACIGEDKTRCMSAVSQRKGELTAQEEVLLCKSGLVWGCDVCQEACPLNTEAKIEPHPCFDFYEPVLTDEALSDLSRKAYGWRGKAVLHRNLQILSGHNKEE